MVIKSHPKHKDCSENRELILDAAAVLLKEVGYKKMTIDELARQAGLGKGTVYLYFESKQDVALSYIDRQNAKMQSALRELLQDRSFSRTRLKQMLVQRVMFRFQLVQGHKEGIDDLLIELRPQLFERRAKYMVAEARIFAELLIEGRTTGEFEVEDPFRVAEAFVDATNALLPHSLSPKQLGDESQLYDRVSILSDLLVRSVTSQQSTSLNSTDHSSQSPDGITNRARQQTLKQ